MTRTALDLPRSNRTNSPFRYPGGKFYARRLILDVLPPHTDYAEPFAGGASVFFAKPTSPGLSLLNDLDTDVMNTMVTIRDNVEGLIGLLDGVEASRDNHAFYKLDYVPANDLERAFRWFFLNRTSYSGIMRPENCYWGYGPEYSMRPENWPPHLRTVSDKLQDVSLACQDFEEVIDALPDGCLAFVDPPYYGSDQQKFYNVTFDGADHLRLGECLKKHRSRILFLLTYDDHPDIRDLYDWTSSIDGQRWNYTISRTDDQQNGLQKRDGFYRPRDKGNELFIRNYVI